jgi:hypothetical protein
MVHRTLFSLESQLISLLVMNLFVWADKALFCPDHPTIILCMASKRGAASCPWIVRPQGPKLRKLNEAAGIMGLDWPCYSSIGPLHLA